jgi:integrase
MGIQEKAMHLVFSTKDFKINGQAYEGFPLLFRGDGVTLEYEVLQFLKNRCLKSGSVASKKSWERYGRDMYDFFSFCEANDLDWRNVQSRKDSTILAIYRDASIEHFNLSASTVNQRLRLLIKFYQYAVSRGWCGALPYEIENVIVRKPKAFLAHTDTTGGMKARPDVMLKQPRTKIKLLNGDQIRQLLISIKNPTLRLMVRLGLMTGLRKEEILTFPLKYVVNPAEIKARSHIAVSLKPQDMEIKGSVERSINIPLTLMAEFWDYCLHERNQRLAGKHESVDKLFVTARGRSFSSNSRAFNTLLNDLKLPFEVHPHMLRHTYATHTLRDLEARRVRGDKILFNPLLYLRDRLGHASVTTTEKYLHFIHEIECDLRTEYEMEIENLCTEAVYEEENLYG